MTADYKKLELLVAKIQQELAPNAEVIHDVKLKGHDSEVDRQIDVLVRQSIGQYEMKVVIDAKDYKTPVDVKGVEEFQGLVKDVRAQKGVLVCPAGFSEAAKTLASKLEIALYSPIDTDPHKWQAAVFCPVLFDFRQAQISFGLACSAPVPMMIPNDFWHKTVARDADGNELGVPLETALSKWNGGEYPSEPGQHLNLPIFEQLTVHADNGYGQHTPVDLTVSLYVEKQLFWGHIPIEKISGFLDQHTGAVITNAFTTGSIDPSEVWNNWEKLDCADDAPAEPAFRIQGLVGWPV